MSSFQISGLAEIAGEDGEFDVESGDGGSGYIRRESADLAITGAEDQVLGTLHCTMKYSFDKNALIVTVNKCVNLPPKDLAAKSR